MARFNHISYNTHSRIHRHSNMGDRGMAQIDWAMVPPEAIAQW